MSQGGLVPVLNNRGKCKERSGVPLAVNFGPLQGFREELRNNRLQEKEARRNENRGNSSWLQWWQEQQSHVLSDPACARRRCAPRCCTGTRRQLCATCLQRRLKPGKPGWWKAARCQACFQHGRVRGVAAATAALPTAGAPGAQERCQQQGAADG